MWASIKEKFRGWKTVIANAIVGVPALLYGLYLEFSTIDVTPVIPAKYAAAFMVGWAILGVILRIITTGPLGSKGTEASTPKTKAGD